MKHIANILTSDPFSASELYNVTAERASLIPGIPTLIIGWERTKEEYPDASIIEWQVANDVYWTYGKYERREKFEEKFKKFEELAIKKFIESASYTYYDILLGGKERFESFVKFMQRTTPEKTVYVSGDMMYIYASNMEVIGVSLRDCDYMDPTFKKILFSTIYNNQSIKVLKNNNEISREIRYKFKNREYMVPYIFS